jgi:hypothetical protein
MHKQIIARFMTALEQPNVQHEQTQINTLRDSRDLGSPLTPNAIQNGHGKFPYVIVRMFSGIYMQMPIHVVKERTPEMTGIVVQTKDLRKKKSHKFLVEVATDYQRHLDMKGSRKHRVCLVLSPKRAYYLEENVILISTSIPSGGTLVNSKQQVIAMGNSHFIS